MTARLLAIAITVALLYLLWWAITDGADLWAELPGFLRWILGWIFVGGVVTGVCGWVGSWLVRAAGVG
jgi:hypothetical protein